MTTLPAATWLRLAVWLVAGLAVFFGYARRHAPARDGGARRAPHAAPLPVAGS